MSMNLRPTKLEDAAALAAIYNYYIENTVVTFETEPVSVEEFRGRIQRVSADYPYLTMERQGEIVGYAYASRYRDRAAYQWCAELSLYVRQDCRRGGIGRALYTGLLADLTERGIYNAYACITVPNDESMGFHRAFGFRDSGTFRMSGFKHGEWHDIAWLELRLPQKLDKPTD
ncbi:N-acetyltransferase [Clostridia bacterium]|nr:N-acetyltransferase [Clostridia bacterium]